MSEGGEVSEVPHLHPVPRPGVRCETETEWMPHKGRSGGLKLMPIKPERKSIGKWWFYMVSYGLIML